ncbi:hypothetical protein, partial [Erwinia sp. S38]|uniref:hypothetical protein n=1 Tax=Erwinia sp. S38 TaxID=2769338 RepID=UPI001F3EE58E
EGRRRRSSRWIYGAGPIITDDPGGRLGFRGLSCIFLSVVFISINFSETFRKIKNDYLLSFSA